MDDLGLRILAPLLTLGLTLGLTRGLPAQDFSKVPVPAENPVTPAKAVLGKILFWDEQLSSSNTMACGSCHQPRFGGSDGRLQRHAGPDGRLRTADDVFGSPGNQKLDANGKPTGHRNLTTRIPLPIYGAAHAPKLFWDGRAGDTFKSPLDGKVKIRSGAALENQTLEPILNHTEMARRGRTWQDVTDKLAKVTPLGLATKLPADTAAAIQKHETYPKLFAAAFGDEKITPTRIAFAIATYERTLVPDQTPYDKFLAGDPSAITLEQMQGLAEFSRARCTSCHKPPHFTDYSFRNIGVRPEKEDIGREKVTGRRSDIGKFKVPTMRNIGLRKRFMHNGRFGRLTETFRHYRVTGRYGQKHDLVDPILMTGIYIDFRKRDVVVDFLVNALTDPRVKNEAPPFDRPTLASERPAPGSERAARRGL